jgi:photosystem II stability/assembly factor-like uncharacterized protein
LFSVHFKDNNIGWAVGEYGTILKTTNGGTNWTTYTSGTIASLWSVHFTDNNTGWVVGSVGTIIKTTNGGTNWTAQSSGNTYSLFSVHFTDNTTGWAVGYWGTILKTTNGGTNWTAYTSGTIASLWSVHFTDNNTGWAVGSVGTILKTTNGGVTFINDKEEPSLLTNYSLSQNYPNPFNPVTRISWQSPVRSHQTLKVYDILGNKVATLVDEYKPAGSYEVEFDAIGLSSGIYFYRLAAGSFIETKKMIILR